MSTPANLLGTAIFLILIFSISKARYTSRVRSWTHRMLPGPPEHTFWLGNTGQWLLNPAGELDFNWQERYGYFFQIRNVLGSSLFMVSDPKAMYHILHSASTRFPQPAQRRAFSELILGPGVVSAQGPDHKRYRNLLDPLLNSAETKEYISIFRTYGRKLCDVWREHIENSEGTDTVVDVAMWTSRATLDALGQAIFEYDFQALEDHDNELVKAYHNLLTDIYGPTSRWKVFLQLFIESLPLWLFKMAIRIPSRSTSHLHQATKTSLKFSSKILSEKKDGVLKGDTGAKDLTSRLVKANMLNIDASERLNDAELTAQMRTLMFVGHDTTAMAISFALYELSQNHDIQEKLRIEVSEARERSGGDISSKEMESMTYCLAFIKEVLRFHPPLPVLARQCQNDDIIPLLYPLQSKDGKETHEVFVKAGQNIWISLCSYNRSKDIWGEDAGVFRPERWLQRSPIKAEAHFGLYSSLATFSQGPASCLGFRFALSEVQSFLIEIIGVFNLELEPEKCMWRMNCGIMAPAVVGELEKGMQLPLRISLVD